MRKAKKSENCLAIGDRLFAQSWTALFRAFSSHRQPSAIFSKVFPAEDVADYLQFAEQQTLNCYDIG